MADSQDRRSAERAEAAARRRAGKVEINRVTMDGHSDHEFRSRWDSGLGNVTTPSSLVDNWSGTGGGAGAGTGEGGEGGIVASSADASSSGQQSNDS